MISKLDVTAIKVLDQDQALDFYVNKLGLEVAQDFQQRPVRWLTVRVPGEGRPAGDRLTGRTPGPT